MNALSARVFKTFYNEGILIVIRTFDIEGRQETS